jgi:hypothetical protein
MVRGMKRTILLVAVLGCGGGMSPPGSGDDEPTIDAGKVDPLTCSNGQDAKIKFTQDTGCGNDGSVEFCIPDSDPALSAKLQAIDPRISCAAGGGRAMCSRTPGLLLCFYPTRETECITQHGAMTAATWADMCEIAGEPQITEIVHTVFD